MKKYIPLFIAFGFALCLQSFINVDVNTLRLQEIKKSKITWKGYKIAGSHEGQLTLKSGLLTFDKNKLVGGVIEVDMTSINCTDLEGEQKQYLEGHLKSEEFFGVDNYPLAKLVFNNVIAAGQSTYNIKADLTIKNKTKEIEFIASIYGNKALANLQIDRTEFGIKYGSGTLFSDLKDKMIFDNIELNIEAEF